MRIKIPAEYKETSQHMSNLQKCDESAVFACKNVINGPKEPAICVDEKPYRAVAILPGGHEIVLAEFDNYPAARAFINRTTLGTR